MAIANRQDLKAYCLRELGAPVIEINVDDEQLEDRIDQSLDFFRLYHYDGIEQMYMKQQITASELHVTSGGTTFALEEVVTGQTSGATAKVTNELQRASTDTMILCKDITGTFVPGETITGTGAHSAVLADPAFKIGVYDQRYIDLPDYVWGITKILNIGMASSSKNLFDLQYQLRLNDLYDLTSTSIIYYKTVMNHLDLLDFELNGPVPFRFNRLQSRLFIDMKWRTDVQFGQYIIIQGYRALDPNSWALVWNENWLKRYVTALFKKQWGTNMKKFGGLQLPGVVTLNGQETYDEAQNEIAALEDELMRKSAPLDFFLG